VLVSERPPSLLRLLDSPRPRLVCEREPLPGPLPLPVQKTMMLMMKSIQLDVADSNRLVPAVFVRLR
jgi:hypothetical protein